jgi:hypothetical protein
MSTSTIAESSYKRTSSVKTFRVRNIPPEFRPRSDATKTFLERVLGWTPIEVHSLDFSPDGDTKVATITCTHVQGNTDRFETVVPIPDGLQVANTGHLIVDNHFEGFTTLGSPEGDEGHRIESASPPIPFY